MVLTKNKFLSDSELKAILDLCNKHKGERDSILIRFALFTGARQSEVLEVKRCDLSECGATIYGKKNSKDRTVPLPKDFYNELMEYAKNLLPGEKLFNISSRHFRRIWDAWRVNPRKGLHCTRHTHGVKLYNNCKDIKAVQLKLGHKSILNTQVYVDYVDGQEKLRQSSEGMWDKPLDVVG